MLILGAPALLTSIVVAVILASGAGQGAFLLGRLDSPIGYVNGTAGLLVMGVWPFIALADTAERRLVRALGGAGACLIAATAVTTQSRAILPALLLATLLVLIAAPERARRALTLVIVGISVAASLHWTLALYSSTGPVQALPIPTHDLRDGGLAILLAGVLGFTLKLALSILSARQSADRRERAVRLLGRGLLVATVLGAVSIGVIGHSTISRQWDAFTQLNPEQSAPDRFLAAGGFRYDLWRIAVDEFRSDPLGGVGAGSYDSEYYRLRKNPQSVIQPHSLELQMAAELGILGVLSLLVFCGAILVAGLRRTRRTLASSDPMVRIAALGMFTAWLAATSVDWLYDIPGIAGMAILAAAALVVPGEESGRVPPPRTGGRPPNRLARLGVVMALGVLALLAASIGRQYAAARYQDDGAAKVARSPAQAISTLETAEALDPYSLQTLYSIATAYARLDDYTAARETVLKAEQLEPDDYVPAALLGDLAFRRGDYAVALASYRHALALDPREPALSNAIQQAEQALR
jgi:hypothetical protein